MPLLKKFKADNELIIILENLRTPVLTAETLFERESKQLARDAGCSLIAIEALKIAVAKQCLQASAPAQHSAAAPDGTTTPFESAHALFVRQTADPVSTGCRAIDELLGGGIKMHEVTEFFGRSGTGKSQVCFSLAAEAAVRGIQVFFVDTSNGFSGSRVTTLVQRRLGLDEGQVTPPVSAAMSRIIVAPAFDIYGALDVLERLESEARKGGQPFLVIVDSVTPLVAPVLGGEGKVYAGQGLLGHLHAALHQLCATSPAAVVVTNEARGVHGDHDDSGGGGLGSGGGSERCEALKPALGKSWTYCASVRVFLRARPTLLGDEASPLFTAVLQKHPRREVNQVHGAVHELETVFAEYRIGRFGLE